MFCSSNTFKRRQIGGRNIPKRLNVTILPLDPPFLADDTETGTSLLNNSNISSRPGGNPEAMMNVPEIGQSSGSGASESEGPAAKTRSISLLQTRQFYHSRTLQPMTLEEVMSDRDSEDEVDDEDADLADRHRIDNFEDVSPTGKNFMRLWNSFVRKQRVITDGQVPWACEAFSKFHKKEFTESKPLHSCWRMFMIKLWEYGLLDAVTINKCNLIIEDSEDDPSGNTNNSNSEDYGIDLNRTDTMDVDNNGVDLGIDLERSNAMDVNNNNVDRGIDLNRNVTMNVNTSNVDRGIDLNGNVTMNVNTSNVDRGIDLNRNDVMDVD
ncbi:Polycomb group protein VERNALIZATION 2 [Raphanus sativus]|nr:Polycomb group protein VERNALIZATION 2 [Raphanus sativus]